MRNKRTKIYEESDGADCIALTETLFGDGAKAELFFIELPHLQTR